MATTGSRLEAAVPVFSYLGGEEVIEKLKMVSGVEKDIQLADVFGVPKNTIATWRKRGLTPYELLLRASLFYGADLKALALGEGELFPDGDFSESRLRVPYKKLSKGELEDVGSFSLDNSQIDLIDAEPEQLIVIRDSDSLFIVDKSDINSLSGTFLINLDGVYALREIQKLPSKKLAINFDGSPFTISEDDIQILGRVAMKMSKE